MGYTNQEVADELGIHRNTVSKWWIKYQATAMAGAEWLKDQPRSGRPGVTTPHVDVQILAQVRDDPITNASVIRQNLGLDASNQTIRRRLAESG